MKLIKPKVEILDKLDEKAVIGRIATVARTCYKSESSSSEDKDKALVKRLTTSIGITRQIIRHRMASFAIESTRYCNYSKDKFGNELTFIEPSQGANDDWIEAVKQAEKAYLFLVADGWTAEQAREVLPMCTKSEICMKANLREWRHFFKLRCDKHAHPDMRVLALDLLKQMHDKLPVIFDDLYKQFYDGE